MLAEQVEDVRDALLVENVGFGDLDLSTLNAYRNQFKAARPGTLDKRIERGTAMASLPDEHHAVERPFVGIWRERRQLLRRSSGGWLSVVVGTAEPAAD